MTLRLGLVGLDKTARARRLPAIAATQGLDLAAVADPYARRAGSGCSIPGSTPSPSRRSSCPSPSSCAAPSCASPANRQAPIAAELAFAGAGGLSVTAAFDWRETGPQIQDIRVETDEGVLVLSQGGAKLALTERVLVAGEDREYRGLYAEFAALIGGGRSETDLSSLVHAANEFPLGRRHLTEPF